MRVLPTMSAFCRAAGLGAVPILLAGCAASLQPVADFGTAASALSARYRPFVGGLVALCVQRQQYRALGDPGGFDATAVQLAAQARCQPYRNDSRQAAELGQALAAYASALARLAGSRSDALDDDIADLAKTAKGVQDRDGQRFFNAGQLDAASRLAQAVTRWLVQQGAQSLTRQLLVEHQPDLATVVGAMASFVSRSYGGELRDLRETLQVTQAQLVRLSQAATDAQVDATLPFRQAQTAVVADLARAEQAERQAQAFARAADALLQAHQALIDQFDTLGNGQRVAAVQQLARQVRQLVAGLAD